MNDLPPIFARLLLEERVPLSQLAVGNRTALSPLIAGGVLEIEMVGRGEVLMVRDKSAFRAWLQRRFPSFERKITQPSDALRAGSVALRRNSKSTRKGVEGAVLLLRATGDQPAVVRLDELEIPVAKLTAQHGLAACLIASDSVMAIGGGRALLVENLECFLKSELIVPNAALVMYSAGRISDRLIRCLARSNLGNLPLLHLTDYDPVGLSDYLRLRAAIAARVALFVPDDLTQRFLRYGNEELIKAKPRNRALLEKLDGTVWPCAASSLVFELVKENGAGLEQEALLLGLDGC